MFRHFRPIIGSVHDFALSKRYDSSSLIDPVRRIGIGADPKALSRRAAVYVHYDAAGQIHDYVIFQLKELAAADFRIIFVTNSPSFPEEQEAVVAPLCHSVIWRQNLGYDFGAYKDGLAAFGDTSNLECMLLMNDSIYGPFWNLADTIAAIDRSTTDFWGVTDSFQYHYHIQSYFMIFLSAALKSESFQNFWGSHRYIGNKSWVIRNGELKLSRTLIEAGLRAGVLAPYCAVADAMRTKLEAIDMSQLPVDERRYHQRLLRALSRNIAINPAHSFWDVLITDFKCPFVKRELVEVNPVGIPNVDLWPSVIRKDSNYNVTLIESHLDSHQANGRGDAT